MTRFFRNFSVAYLQNISGQTVFKKGDFTVLLDFETARSAALGPYGERIPT
jgi:hypothetical protein